MSSRKQSNFFVHTLLRARDWQHRPEFEQVCQWWRGGGRGVCALVGMGGAGKTAIAERFLRVLPGGLPEDPDVVKDQSLPQPPSTFAFSFYDAPNPESFFEVLQMWLEDTPRPESVASVSQLKFMIQRTAGLMILDGLEKVQEDGSCGVFGRLSSPKLRDFLDHLAGGFVPDVGVLVTSRFPLADLRDTLPRFFRTIAIDQFDVATGVQLLRDRGVRGNDLQLEPIVEECGRHAFTVDLAGGYIKEFGNGDPATPLKLGTAEELQAEAEQEPDDDKRAVLMQSIRFARIAQRYRAKLVRHPRWRWLPAIGWNAAGDPAALALLERICLLRIGVDCAKLAAIFTGPGAEKVSGKALAGLDAKQLQKKLDWLVRMRIVEATESSSPNTHYSIHPAVRDGFLNGIGQEDREASHEAVRRGLEASLHAGPITQLGPAGVPVARLGDRPGERYPSDPATLDLLEEIVHHTLQSGHVLEAWDVYQNRLGGCENLIASLNDYVRASRVTDSILQAHETGDTLPDDVVVILRSDFGYSSLELGNIGSAATSLSKGLELCQRTKSSNLDVLAGNLSCALSESGYLRSALETLRNSLPCLSSPESILRALKSIAEIENLRGTVQVTITESDIRSLTGKVVPPSVLSSLPKTLRSERLDHHRSLDESKTKVENLNKQYANGHSSLADARLDLCERFLFHGEIRSAISTLSKAKEWAVAHDAREFLCRCALVQARIELSAISDQQSAQQGERGEHLTAADLSITEGLKIARDCGFALQHIDLLLERARLHLFQGNTQSALDDLRLAIDDGIGANDETGQPELIAATHEQCGYAWAIAEGLHLRGEALLLEAAQTLGLDSFAPAKQNNLPAEATALIDKAKQNLEESLACWLNLRDPEPTDNNNFNHPETGDEYNFRATETFQVLVDLSGGMLTSYSLEPHRPEAIDIPTNQTNDGKAAPPMPTSNPVFVCYAHKDNESTDPSKRWLDRLREHLEPLVQQDNITVCSDQETDLGDDWHDHIQTHLNGARAAVLLVSPAFLASKYIRNSELPVLLKNAKDQGVRIIPVILRPCLFTETKFKYPDPNTGPEEFLLSSLQAAGSPTRALSEMNEGEQDRALLKVAQTLAKLTNP